MAGTVIAVASGKGGAGKSSLCVLLGDALCRLGRSAVLLDLDFGIRALDLFLGADSGPYHLLDILAKRCRPADALIPLNDSGRFCLCQAPPSQDDQTVIPWELLAPLTDLLAEHFDFVIADCPAGVTPALYAASRVCDRALVITNPEPVAVRSAALCGSLIAAQNPGAVRQLVINRVMPRFRDNILTDFDDIMDTVGLPLAGVIPFDPALSRAAAAGKLASFSREPLTEAVRRTALRLTGKRVPLAIA